MNVERPSKPEHLQTTARSIPEEEKKLAVHYFLSVLFPLGYSVLAIAGQCGLALAHTTFSSGD